MSLPDLLILRHGETEWNRAGRMQGRLDSPLTELGRTQARRQGAILTTFGVSGWTVYGSPAGRVRQTANMALPGWPVVLDERLREIDLGSWNGMLRRDIAASVPHLFETDDLRWYDHAPDGEGLQALHLRVAGFLADVTGPSVVFTHGITSRVMRCVAMGLPLDAFERVGGGQGVVYHLSDGQSEMLA